MELCGPQMEDASALSAAVGVTSVRLVQNMLKVWRNQLSTEQLQCIVSQSKNLSNQSDSGPFPVESLSLNFKDSSGWFLEHGVSDFIHLSVSTGKVMYKLPVKVVNKEKLKGRVDTPWRVHLGLDPGVGPS